MRRNLASARAKRGCIGARWWLLGVLLAAPLRAQQGDTARDAARVLGKQAQVALKQGDFAAARDLFEQAERLYHAPTLVLGLARAQAGLGRLTAALATYRRLPASLPADAPVAFHKAVEAGRRELATLEARVPRLVIHVEGAPEAPVTLDGAPFPGELGAAWPVDPGPHEVQVSVQGRSDAARIEAVEGVTARVLLRLPPASPVPAASSSASGPAAPSVPASSAPVAPSAPSAPPSSSLAGALPLPSQGDPASWRRTAGWIALGTGAAGLATAGVLGLVAMSRRDALLDRCGGTVCPETERDRHEEFLSTRRWASVTGVLGGAGLVVGTSLLLLTPARPRQASVCVPGLTLGLCGVF